MSSITLSLSQTTASCSNFTLSGSKSMSQRALIINSLMDDNSFIENLSNSLDTTILNNCLNSEKKVKNVFNSGTSLRFLLSFYAMSNKSVILTGDKYLFNRPIDLLISYLNSLGANIIKQQNKILVQSGEIKGGDVTIKFAYTSQFLSSLLLIAPYLKDGIRLYTYDNMLSQSYVNMTLSMMRKCGVQVEKNDCILHVPESKYVKPVVLIESDWTSASYLYLSFLFSNLDTVTISVLYENSIQPDCSLISFFSLFGIQSKFHESSVTLTKVNNTIPFKVEWDFSNNPDFALTAFVVCLGLKVDLYASGLDTLPYKESNRIKSIYKEFSKFNCLVSIENNNKIIIKPNRLVIHQEIIDVNTYGDHRIALCLSPLALLGYQLRIHDPNVINKSYPDFYNDLAKFGISINYEK